MVTRWYPDGDTLLCPTPAVEAVTPPATRAARCVPSGRAADNNARVEGGVPACGLEWRGLRAAQQQLA